MSRRALKACRGGPSTDWRRGRDNRAIKVTLAPTLLLGIMKLHGMKIMNLRCGPLAVSVWWISVNMGISFHKWFWKNQRSWKHGCAYIGRIKIIW